MRIVRFGMATTSALVVALIGMLWWSSHHALAGITISHALGIDSPRSAPGEMNILLIGLDSRKDQQGNDLSQAILDQLHAGDSDAGGYNTNTLILAHISSDNHVTAFSIPRDDYVAADGIEGYDHIKIKEAYGLAKAAAEQTLVDEGVGDQAILESKGREAGRAATLRAVRDLTGQPIDNFAEVNLAGFYDLASALGSIQVCLNNPVQDEYSGADFPAGPQTLDAAQALAFVRQRHGLDNGDLDRTHRQQAFLVSVMRQLRSADSLVDFTKLNSLIAIVQKDVVLSTGWDQDRFSRIGAIDSRDVQFQTLPVVRYDTVNDEDVNIVDPVAIKAQVAAAFNGGPPARPPQSSKIDVINAGDTAGLAGSVSEFLTQRGYAAGDVRNPIAGESTDTSVTFGAGADADAAAAASLLGIAAEPRADPALQAGHVVVTLGHDFVLPPAFDQPVDALHQIGDANSDSADPSVGSPDQGKPLDGTTIPCVD
ncbi:LCP family protein [Mycolicibacterium komossense]|nr:LCP family protein [Mycolicibacterium komossense]